MQFKILKLLMRDITRNIDFGPKLFADLVFKRYDILQMLGPVNVAILEETYSVFRHA